jgi:3-dehydroquinate synthase
MSGAKRVPVRIKRQDVSYPVIIQPRASQSALSRAFSSLGLADGRRACVLVDSGFAGARPDVERALKSIFPHGLFLRVAGSEASKTLASASGILGKMVGAGFTRSDLVVAVGGGVIGDLGGFVASVYHRGIGVVHIPTTLLAMVDSSVGGKTAVNLPEGKNLVGTFHQPLAVLDFLDLIETLPEADYRSGLGEVYKYAVGFDARLFNYLGSNAARVLAREPAVLARLVRDCVAIKARIVSLDERETGASRAADRRLLNLGHTLGHGLEKAYRMPHGVAVAIGVTLAARFSARVKLCRQRCYDEIMELGERLGLDSERTARWRLPEILPYVKRDKKMAGGRLQFIGIKSIGRAVVRPTRLEELEVLKG